MRLFAVRATGTVLQALVVAGFQFSTVFGAWTSDIRIHSEVESDKQENPNLQKAVDLVRGRSEFSVVSQYPYQGARASYQSQPLFWGYRKPAIQQYPTEAVYHTNSVGFTQLPQGLQQPALYAPFVPTPQQINQGAFPTWRPQFQQNFHNLLEPNLPLQVQHRWKRHLPQGPWQQLQHPQQYHPGPFSSLFPKWGMNPPLLETPRVPMFHPMPQYPQFAPPLYHPRPPEHHRRQAEFDREYGDREATNANTEEIMKDLDKMINAIRPLRQPLPDNLRFHLFQHAARILGRVASLAVVLISHRNNSDMDKQVDEFLHKMEDKSYQLKTMLIEMGSLSGGDIAVATPPDSIQYQPVPTWTPGAMFPWISPIGRYLENSGPGYLGNLDR